MTKTKKTALLWAPRTLLFAIIILLTLFSLDVFSGDAPLLNEIGGFLIHMLPSFIMVAILVVSWKKQSLGGVLCIIVSVIFTIFFKTYTSLSAFLLITGLPLTCGALFLYSDKIQQEK